jgi:putative copper export protein
LNNFAEWLSTTLPSVFIQDHEAWLIPTLQSLHIIGIAIAIGSALMLTLRVLGMINMDQTLLQNQQRFSPWLSSAVCLLLATGGLLVIGEPVRELVTFSFWLKMFLVAAMVSTAIAFHRAVKRHDPEWGNRFIGRKSVQWAALLSLAIWGCIIILGRLIAYDHIWGHLSPATKA